MRTINPFPRFVTLLGSDAASPGSLNLQDGFVFETDSVLHSISITEFGRLSGALPCTYAVAVALGQNNSVVFSPPWENVIYANNPLNVSATEVTINNALTIPLNDVAVKAGLRIGVYLGGGAGTNVCTISASLQFTSLSEWVNFREPRAGVRI